MALIVDGYNLMHAAGIVGKGLGPGGLERSRLALLNFIVESLDPAEVPRTCVVFDAAQAPYGAPRQLEYRGLTVRFADRHDSADELIEELIRADTSPRRLTVVSSDHRLHKAARRRKAAAIDSEVWYAEAIRRRQERRTPPASAKEPPKPTGPATPQELEYWTRAFSEREESPPLPEEDSIFPPGYGDDVWEE